VTTKDYNAALAHSLRRLADRIEEGQHEPCYVVPRGTRVYDLDKGEEIRMVMEVDGLAGEVEVAESPVRPGPDGTVVTSTMRFKRVVAERDAEGRIIRINCSGRES
jgi:hypothetical protein